MKKIKNTIISTACATLAILSVACSNDDVIDGKKGTQINAAENIEFDLSFSDYNAEDTIDHATRAAQDAELAKPRIVPMGDMMYAEVSLQRDTTKATPAEKAAATRALTDGTYTIYAYQGTTLKGTLKGTVSSNVFTATSSNKEIVLEPGTYTFVCCNDKVQVAGETWTINRADAGTALIGITAGKVITATPRKQKVAFQMQHVASRVRIQLQADGFPVWDATGVFNSTSAIPEQMEFNPSTQTYTYATKTGASLSENITFRTTPHDEYYNHEPYYVEQVPSPYGGSPNWQTKYIYLLPTTSGANLKLSLTGGTAYRLPLSGRSVKFPALASMAANGAYTLRMKLHYNYIYLYSDGTTGQKTDADYSSKTPIAVVVSRSKRIAAALEDIQMTDAGWGRNNITATTTASETLSDHLSDLNGYDYTYSTTYSTDGIVKGDDYANYHAFYKAAHYNPGVTVTGANIGKWYLPSIGEWNLYFKNLVYLAANENLTEKTDYMANPTPTPYGLLYPEVFAVNISIPNIYTTVGYFYWFYLSSSESNERQFYSYCANIRRGGYNITLKEGSFARHFVSKQDKNASTDTNGNNGYNSIYLIRPFVRY